MATYGNSIYQYQNPVQVDLSVLGQAVQYKQQQYDANTMNIQNLVNQYTNMDLARDVDKQYLSERLNTLVNYVNSSGRKDWSRNSVYRDVSNYIGNALDSNVIAGIASTKAYRKQQADFEKMRNDKDLRKYYNVANEYYATQDWEDYTKSTELGRTYKPGQYIDYFDVNKEVIEKAPEILKNFGVQVVQRDGGGNAYFRRINTHEVVTEHEAQNIVNMVIGDAGRKQLAINAVYNNRGASEDQIAERYKSTIQSKINVLQERKEALTASLAGANEKDKAIIKNNIEAFDTSISQNAKMMLVPKGKESMLYEMEYNNFISGWGNVLAYDKLVDTEIDDSNFKLATFEHTVNQDNFKNQLEISKLSLEEQKMQYDLMAKVAKGELVQNADGTYSPGNGVAIGAQNGINAVDVTPTDTDEIPFVTPQELQNEYTESWNSSVSSLNNDFKDPKKRQAIEKEIGTTLDKVGIGNITWSLIGKDGVEKGQERISNLMEKGLISPETAKQLRLAQERYTKVLGVNKDLESFSKSVDDITNKLINVAKKGEVVQGVSDFYIDSKGDIHEGNLTSKIQGDVNSLNKNVAIGMKLHAMNLIAKDAKYSDAEKAVHNYEKERLIKMLPKDKQDAVRQAYGEKSIWNYYESLWEGTKGVGNTILAGIDYLTNDEESGNKNSKDAISNFKKAKSLMNNTGVLDFFRDMGHTSFDLNDWGMGKNAGMRNSKGEIMSGINYLNSDIKSKLQRVNENIQNNHAVYKANNKTITVDTSIKGNESVASLAKAYLPTFNLATDATVSFNVNTETGTATMLVPTKGEKGAVDMQSVEIPLSQIPQNVLKNVDLTTSKSTMYDATIGGSSYKMFAELPKDRKQLKEMYGDSTNDLSSLGIKSASEILDETTKVYGKKFVDKYASEIKDIITSGVSMKAVAVNGQYRLDIENGQYVSERPLGVTNLEPEIDRLTMLKGKIATETIQNNIKQLYGKSLYDN